MFTNPNLPPARWLPHHWQFDKPPIEKRPNAANPPRRVTYSKETVAAAVKHYAYCQDPQEVMARFSVARKTLEAWLKRSGYRAPTMKRVILEFLESGPKTHLGIVQHVCKSGCKGDYKNGLRKLREARLITGNGDRISRI